MSDTTTSVSDPTTDIPVDDAYVDDVLGEEFDDAYDEDGTDEPAAELVAARGRRRHDQRGMATAEYAVGTVAAVALVTALINVFRNKEFLDLLLELVMAIFKAVMASKGLGL